MNEIYNEAFNAYYSLKNQYEKNYEKQKRKIILNDEFSLKEKQKQIKNIEKKCVVCKKSGGTIFNENGKTLSARCGADKQCSLNINITRGESINVIEMIDYIKQVGEINRTDIIMSKLDMLYNYDTEENVISKFSDFKKELEDNNSALDLYKSKLNELMYNSERNEKIKELNLELYNKIDEIKKMISLYKEDPILNSSVFNSISKLMTNEVKLLLEEIRSNKYRVNNIKFNEIDKTYNLEQMYYTPQDLNIPLDNEPVVTAFNISSKK